MAEGMWGRKNVDKEEKQKAGAKKGGGTAILCKRTYVGTCI